MHDRRHFLKSVGLSAITAQTSLLAGCGGSNTPDPVVKRRIHLNIPLQLSGTRDGITDSFVLELPSGARVPMVAHNAESKAVLVSSQTVQVTASSAHVAATHYADAPVLPVNAPGVLRILRRPWGAEPSEVGLHLTSIYLPDKALGQNHATRVYDLRAELGLPVRTTVAMADAWQQTTTTDEFLTPHSTAVAIVYHHPELMTLDALQAAVVKAHIEASPFLDNLVNAIRNQPDRSGDGPVWCKTVQVTDDTTGAPLLFDDGSPIFDYQVSDDIMELAGLVMGDVLRTVKADTSLQGKIWSTSDGIASRTLQASAPMANAGSAGSYDIATSLADGQRLGGVTFSCRMLDPAKRQIEVVLRNEFIRSVGVYVEFIDAAGRSQAVDDAVWENALTTKMRYPEKSNGNTNWLFYPENSAFLDFLAQTTTFMGIPVVAQKSTHFITLPEAYSGVRLKLGTLGYDTFRSVNGGVHGQLHTAEYLIGAATTLLFDVVVPGIFLCCGVGMKENGFWRSLCRDVDFIISLAGAVISTVPELSIVLNKNNYTKVEVERAESRLASQWGRIGIKFADRIAKWLLKSTGGVMLMTRLTAEILEREIVGSIPFIGWALRASALIVTGVRLAQTTIEVASSPGAIVNTIQLSLDLRLTLNPDLDDLEFPVGARYYQIQFQKDQTTFYQTDWIPIVGVNAITETFRKLPSGGSAKVYAVFCDEPNGTILGKGMAARYLISQEAIDLLKAGRANYQQVPAAVVNKLTPLLDKSYTTTRALVADLRIYLGSTDSDTYRKAIVGMLADTSIPLLLQGAATVIDIECTIDRQLTPMTAATVFRHDRILDYVGDSYQWRNTNTSPVVSDDGRINVEPSGITLAQRSGQIGYVWRSLNGTVPVCPFGDLSNEVYTAQNLSTRVDPNQALKRMSYNGATCGVSEGAGVYYKLTGDTDGHGENFLLESFMNGLHVRPIPINTPQEQFLDLAIRRVSYGTFHRMPTAVAWHPGNYLIGVHKSLHKLEVLDLNQGLAMNDASAPAARLLGGLGTRPGLLRNPTCIACTLNGAVLVLESDVNRVQAFDIHGSPIRFFRSTSLNSGHFLQLFPYSDVTYLDMGVDATGYIYVLSHRGNGQRSTDYNLEIYAASGAILSRTNGFTAARIAVDLWRTVYTLNWQTLRGHEGRAEPTVSRWLPVN